MISLHMIKPMLEGMDEECKAYWNEVRPRLMRKHSVRARKRWDAAFGPDWDYDYLLDAMMAKLKVTIQRMPTQFLFLMVISIMSLV